MRSPLIRAALRRYAGWARLAPDDNGNPRIWNRQDGTPAASFEVSAQSVRFLGGRDEGSLGAEEGEAQYYKDRKSTPLNSSH